MATIKIGGRDLDVRECTLKDLKQKVRPFQQAMGNVESLDDVGDKLVDLLAAFLGHNAGVTPQWIEESIPLSALRDGAFIGEFYVAIGLKQKEQPASGEAKSQ